MVQDIQSKHNNDKEGYWMAIENKVYDLTKFVDFHPSGSAILLANSGIDATHAFEQVAHDTNAEIVSLMDSYEIGIISPVKFESPDAERMYNYLLKFLTLIVEMENTFQFDATSMHRTLYEDERDLMDTRYLKDKLGLHRRVLLTMAPVIGGGELQLLMVEFQGLMTKEGSVKVKTPNDSYSSLLKTHNGRCSLHTLHIFKYLSVSKDWENPIHHRTELSAYIHSLMGVGQKFLSDAKIAIAEALAKLEALSSGVKLKSVTPDILKHLGSIIGIIKKYLSNLKDILANRYVLKENRTAKMLWEQLRIRFQERCLVLLARPPVLHEIVHEAVTAADALNEYAREISLRLAFINSEDQMRPRSGSMVTGQRSLGLAKSISRFSFNDGQAEAKQMARIIQSLNQVGVSSEDPASYSKKLLATEYIKSFLLADYGKIDKIMEEEGDADNEKSDVEKVDNFICYEIYIQEKCGFSTDAIKLLRSQKVRTRAIDVTHNQQLREMIMSRSNCRQFPQVFVGSKFIGGLAELQSLQSNGLLTRLHLNDDESIHLRRITKDEAKKFLTYQGLPDYVLEALDFLNQLFEESPDIRSTSFDEFRYHYLGKEYVEKNQDEFRTRTKSRLGSIKRRNRNDSTSY